jgi:TolA-binding protein
VASSTESKQGSAPSAEKTSARSPESTYEEQLEKSRARLTELRRERAELQGKLEELEELEDEEFDALDELEELEGRRRPPARTRARGAGADAPLPRRRRLRRARRNFDDSFAGRILDDQSSMLRAWTDSYLSGMRAWGDIMADYAESVRDRQSEREYEEGERSTRGSIATRSRSGRRSRRRGNGFRELGDLPSDLYEGWLDAWDEAADIPRQTMDDFYESYRRRRP